MEFVYLLFKSMGIWKIAADSGWIMGNEKETGQKLRGLFSYFLRLLQQK